MISIAKFNFLYFFILVFSLSNNFVYSMDQRFYYDSQPAWDDNLDFDNIENQLLNQNIKKLIDMRDYLSFTGKIAHYTNEVYLAIMENGLKAVFKPEENLHDSYAEVAAYRASKFLGHRLVPPTVFKEYENRIGSLQFFVESNLDLLISEQNIKARAILSEKDISDMYLFYFIFGQWDIHAGNQMIAINKHGEAKIALIDNGAISNTIKIIYGDYAFVKRLHLEGVNFDDQPFPYNDSQLLKLPTSVEGLREIFKDYVVTDIPLETLVERWNGLGSNFLVYVIWKDGFWIQFYKLGKKVSRNYTDIYFNSTIEAYKSLDINMLKDFFAEAIEDKAKFCDESFLKAILERRDQVLSHVNSSNLIVD